MNRFITPFDGSFEQPLFPSSDPIGLFARLRSRLIEAFRRETEGFDHLVHLALNEAEALALQTQVPQLVFPMLASEKLQRVAKWVSKQRRVQDVSGELAFSA